MTERGKKEKERRDQHAREEQLEVGMKVLLKNKAKKKGQPKYDPNPYTITKLTGRQATLERGNRKITRESQKFKRFYEPQKPSKERKISKATDDWEESWRAGSKQQQARETAEEIGHDSAQLTNAGTNPGQEANREMHEAESAQQPTTERQEEALGEPEQPASGSGRRTSNRERRARDMYGRSN